MAPEPKEKVIPAAHDVVDEVSMFAGRQMSDAMALDEFGEAGNDVGSAVQHGLIGPKAKIGQKHFARPAAGGQALGDGHRHGRRAGTTRAGDRHEMAGY